MKTLKVWIYVSLLTSICYGQDIHWSQFNYNPIFLSPSKTGDFKGDYRFHSNFRNQWKSVTKPFTTSSFSFDMPIENFHDIAVGALFFNDFAGDGKLTTNELTLSAGKPFQIDSNLTFRIGINLGINNRNFNPNNLKFDNQYNGVYFDPNSPNFENLQSTSKTNLTTGIGFNLDQKIKTFEIQYGLAFYNLNRPNQGFYGAKVLRPIRTSFFSNLKFPLTNKLYLFSALNLQIQKKYSAFTLGSSIHYKFKFKNNNTDLSLGCWYRIKDAFIINLGANYLNWYGGLSYDITLSSLKVANNFRGGPEFVLRYIISKYKPENTFRKICPDYL